VVLLNVEFYKTNIIVVDEEDEGAFGIGAAVGETSDGVNILLRGENCFVRGEGALLAERTSSTKSDATVRMVTKQQQQQQHQEQDGNGGGMGGVGIGGQPGGPGVGGPIGPARTQAQYSIPGILHFLQHEWARFEMERSQWEVERAELQARIAFLQGERKGQENLKQDLVRRIKMLEHALKQERAKLHKLKYGVDLNQEELKPPTFDSPTEENFENNDGRNNSNLSWRQGRKLLRQYLEEIGYTDTIIDVRSQRVRSILGLQNRGENDNDQMNNVAGTDLVNGEANGSGGGGGPQGSQTVKRGDAQIAGRGQPVGQAKTVVGSALSEMALVKQEEAVLATFDFLRDPGDPDDEGDISDEEDGPDADVEPVDTVLGRNVKAKRKIPGMMENEAPMEEDGIEEESVLAEFDFLTSETGSGEGHSDRPDDPGWSPNLGGVIHPYSGLRQNYPQSHVVPNNDQEPGLDIGELGQITVQNDDAAAASGVGTTGGPFRKTWTAKYTLRSHFDSVRALCFHPIEPVLITASEDHTLKLWNLQKTVPAKKSAALDVEPIYTFRAHSGPVLSLAVHPTGSHAYSGGYDATIRVWNIPSPGMDPYDAFDPSVLAATLVGHTDAVWDLAAWQGTFSGANANHRDHLLSVSADGTVKLWDPLAQDPLLNTFNAGLDQNSFPTSVDFIRNEGPSGGQMVVGLGNAAAVIYDLEKGQPVTSLESRATSDDTVHTQINKIISHPSLPVTITAHEDRHIRFFDNGSGKMIHSMVAHLDAVTSLAVDPNGLYLLSGSHDCSIRLWNLDSKTCVQEITSHRKKFDESIFGVAFHPSKPYIASAGADALAKVFV